MLINAASAEAVTYVHTALTNQAVCLKKDTTPANITFSIRFTTYFQLCSRAIVL